MYDKFIVVLLLQCIDDLFLVELVFMVVLRIKP